MRWLVAPASTPWCFSLGVEIRAALMEIAVDRISVRQPYSDFRGSFGRVLSEASGANAPEKAAHDVFFGLLGCITQVEARAFVSDKGKPAVRRGRKA